jgi:hypothetical protein
MGGHRHRSALRQPSCHSEQLKIHRCFGGADVCHSTASAIASASMKSFLFDFTNGFTN